VTVRLPAAYALERAGSVRAAIRRDLVPRLAPWLLAPTLELPPAAEALGGGRGGAWRLELAGGLRVVVRRYRRGGLVARVVADRYVGTRPRPLRELAVTAEARRRGVSAPEVLAARVDGGLVYRGALVTLEVPGARTLIDALRDAAGADARCALAADAGRAVAALHAAGVYHADLNLTNILVRPAGGDAVLVDFDRARLRRGSLGARARRRNLARLRRSLAKLDPHGVVGGADVRRAFAAAYGPGTEAACGP
jgi:3-deoxy-D-manno-octulosonic acid kinase